MPDEWPEYNPSLNELIAGLSDELTCPSRPFTGQPHTAAGERGKTEIRGIRFRDLADCVVCAFVDAAAFTIKDEEKRDTLYRRADDGTLDWNDVYELDLGQMDPLALVQNISCRVEKLMGIYPNVGKLEPDDD